LSRVLAMFFSRRSWRFTFWKNSPSRIGESKLSVTRHPDAVV